MRNIEEIEAKINSIRGKVAAHKVQREKRNALIKRLGMTENDWHGYETFESIMEVLKTTADGREILEEIVAREKQ